jgi:hypothetical protein
MLKKKIQTRKTAYAIRKSAPAGDDLGNMIN